MTWVKAVKVGFHGYLMVIDGDLMVNNVDLMVINGDLMVVNDGEWWLIIYLVGGWPTPLKSSVGVMKFPTYGKIKIMFHTTNQIVI